ncbi:MAG: glycosyltransferase family 1 protein [Desulfonatronovibrio sp. MSAO_Bac4]|nr:MAG: glycosyltransferase family 1 protein [Desulfonatronovibrio sp. MSAO_Bac4]
MSFKIGLEASSSLSNRLSGIQRYIIELSSALSKISQNNSEYKIELCYKGSRIKKAGLRPEARLPHKWYWPFPGFTLRRYDLVHALDTTLPFPLPQKLICTVHDLFSLKVEGYSRPKFREKKKRAYEQIIQNCLGVIVPSLSTKKDLVESFNYPESKVFVVPHGVHPSFFSKITSEDVCVSYDCLSKPYILAFGGRERKNFFRVIKAYFAAGLEKDYSLAVVGNMDIESRYFVQQRKAIQGIKELGRVADDLMPGLYKDAAMLCFPSLYEGFGLPVIEAMAAETPVLTSNIGATADIGHNHAVLVDPMSVSEIASGMQKALHLDKVKLKKAGMYARRYTWEKAAINTREIYKSLLQSE